MEAIDYIDTIRPYWLGVASYDVTSCEGTRCGLDDDLDNLDDLDDLDVDLDDDLAHLESFKALF